MSDGHTAASIRAQLSRIVGILDGIEQSASSWADFFSRLREVELRAILLEHQLRDPVLTYIGQAERFAELAHIPLARHAIRRAERTLP